MHVPQARDDCLSAYVDCPCPRRNVDGLARPDCSDLAIANHDRRIFDWRARRPIDELRANEREVALGSDRKRDRRLRGNRELGASSISEDCVEQPWLRNREILAYALEWQQIRARDDCREAR